MPPRKQARDSRTHLGAFLGEQLREIRAEAGYASQDDFSPVIRKDRSVIGKAETGESPPTESVLADWLDLCGVSGRLRAMFEGVTRIARIRENPGSAQAEPFYGAEARAHTVRYWAPIILPGIVQTPAYATELFKAMRFDAAKVAERLEVRMSRQSILERPDPPDITIVLWEPVLHHQIGTGETMAVRWPGWSSCPTCPRSRFMSCRPLTGRTPDSAGPSSSLLPLMPLSCCSATASSRTSSPITRK